MNAIKCLIRDGANGGFEADLSVDGIRVTREVAFEAMRANIGLSTPCRTPDDVEHYLWDMVCPEYGEYWEWSRRHSAGEEGQGDRLFAELAQSLARFVPGIVVMRM